MVLDQAAYKSIPILSRAYVDNSDLAVRKSLEVFFEIQNSFFSIGIGGQLVMAMGHFAPHLDKIARLDFSFGHSGRTRPLKALSSQCFLNIVK